MKEDKLAIFEDVLISGDLSQLNPDQRVAYYNKTCESLKLNPLTRPFEYIRLNGKLTLYAKRDCTDQLRKNYGVSIKIIDRTKIDDIFMVTAEAALPSGRLDASIGAVSIAGLRGEAYANALMKAETKAKRRVTLSICGLGLLDETEADSISHSHQNESSPKTQQPTLLSNQEPKPQVKVYNSDGHITEAQQKRLFAIAMKNGWTKDSLKSYLKDVYEIEHTKDIPWTKYEMICNHVERGNHEEYEQLSPQTELLQ